MSRKINQTLNTFLAIMICCLVASMAEATTCKLNLEKAYQEAEKHGWQFSCLDLTIGKNIALNFDNFKRVGCVAKSGPLPGFDYRYSANFFKKGTSSNSSNLSNGWRIQSYLVTGGQYQKVEPKNGSRLRFEWTIKKPGFSSKRHVSEIKLNKKNGNCENVYSEAFD